MVNIERVPRAKVLVMPTAYVPHTQGSETDIRAELGLDRSLTLIGSVGGLRLQKRFDLLLDAHAQLLRRVAHGAPAQGRARDPHLVIAGDGPCRAELERRIGALGLDKRVHLLGHRRDIDAILRQIDVAVMSSEYEGMPLFVFECMAAAVPLVATAVGGVPDVVKDGETGLLVAPHDAAGLASAIERVLADPQLGANLARAAAARLDQFTIDSVARRFADLYEQLTAEAHTQSPTVQPAVASDWDALGA
jgi:glycosyltransferase involved in cell wall biosynthesis